MKKQIIGIVIGLALLSLTSAMIVMVAGENKTITFDDTVKDCFVEGTLYNVNGINLTENGNQVIVSVPENYQPDKITVTCEVRGERVESDDDGGGGGYYPATKKYTVKELNETDEPSPTTKDKDKPKEIEESEEKTSLWKIILVVVAAVLILVGIIYWMFQLSDREEESDDSSPPKIEHPSYEVKE